MKTTKRQIKQRTKAPGANRFLVTANIDLAGTAEIPVQAKSKKEAERIANEVLSRAAFRILVEGPESSILVSLADQEYSTDAEILTVESLPAHHIFDERAITSALQYRLGGAVLNVISKLPRTESLHKSIPEPIKNELLAAVLQVFAQYQGGEPGNLAAEQSQNRASS